MDQQPGPSTPGSSSSSSSSKDSNKHKGGSRRPKKSPPSSPKGSNSGSCSVSSTNDAYEREKSLMRVKGYDGMKLPALPKSAAEARTFRNSIFNVVCKMAKTDEAPVFRWVQNCTKPSVDLSDSLPYPVLDRVLGSKLLELAKGTRFAMHFQTVQEEAQKDGRQPKGRKLLWIIFEKYKWRRTRGSL